MLKFYRYAKDIIYFLCFAYIILGRWSIFGEDITLIEAVSTEILFFPCMMLISLFYFYYRYYTNAFISTRLNGLGDCEHVKSLLKESVKLSLWQIMLILLLSFDNVTFQHKTVLFSIVLVIISTYCALVGLYFIFYRLFRNYYIPFLLMSVVIVLYKIIVTWWYMYGNYSVTNPDISQNVLLIIVNGMICLSCFINMKLRKGRIKMLEKISMLKKYIIYFLLEIISLYLLKGSVMNPASYAFNDLFFMFPAEQFLRFLVWVFPKLYIFYMIFNKFYHHYRYNLLFYIVRIKNKTRWMTGIILDDLKDIVIFSIIKLLCTSLIFGFMPEMIVSSLMYVLYLMMFSFVLYTLYLGIKKIEVFNGFLAVYMFAGLMISYLGIETLYFWIQDFHWINDLIYIIGIVVLYMVDVWMLSKDEYYG